ncbi:hypothetical protein [Mesorhizobium sp. B4-1-4]|uniref:hypothetical protein n=1 Tax=Mesorhizobium sp. B4-1-4 TaxID=2589888 RepID=UPI0015E44E9D|nr:hypothetical protein [Mesorhizobium sp. B4-1-4]UCI33209.1 hypothetical protein FJW03_07160 [Mesorhizobium sp. B4-1-4]
MAVNVEDGSAGQALTGISRSAASIASRTEDRVMLDFADFTRARRHMVENPTQMARRA